MCAANNQELTVLLHLELQESEKLQRQVKEECSGIIEVLDAYGDYKMECLEADKGTGATGRRFSEYIRSRNEPGGTLVNDGGERRSDSEEDGEGTSRSGGGGGQHIRRGSGRGATVAVAPTLISTTALLAKLTKRDLN